jgi:hypothetical protein
LRHNHEDATPANLSLDIVDHPTASRNHFVYDDVAQVVEGNSGDRAALALEGLNARTAASRDRR